MPLPYQLVLYFIVATLTGCSQVRAQPWAEDKTQELNVFAAASLTEAFTAIAAEFETSNPNTKIVLNFAGSQSLRLQIEEGARADLFASANVQHADALLRANLIEPPVIFSKNRLVVVVPASNPAATETLVDLTRPGLKLVLAGPEVPVGRYAREALQKLDRHPELPFQFSGQVLANLVSEENNVKAVLAKIQLDEADAGIVYRSDVTPAVAGDLIMIAIPAEYNVEANYPIATTAHSLQAELAQQLVDFLLSPKGQTLLADHNFQPAQLEALETTKGGP